MNSNAIENKNTIDYSYPIVIIKINDEILIIDKL